MIVTAAPVSSSVSCSLWFRTRGINRINFSSTYHVELQTSLAFHFRVIIGSHVIISLRWTLPALSFWCSWSSLWIRWLHSLLRLTNRCDVTPFPTVMALRISDCTISNCDRSFHISSTWYPLSLWSPSLSGRVQLLRFTWPASRPFPMSSQPQSITSSVSPCCALLRQAYLEMPSQLSDRGLSVYGALLRFLL